MNNFSYFNPNPTSKIDKKTGKPKRWTKGDCVIRAFCGVLNLPWDIVYGDLCKLGAKYHDMPNSRKIIDKYASSKGLIKESLPFYTTVSQFAYDHDGVYLVNLRSHVACVKENKVNDCWNCGNYKMKTYYKLSY